MQQYNLMEQPTLFHEQIRSLHSLAQVLQLKQTRLHYQQIKQYLEH